LKKSRWLVTLLKLSRRFETVFDRILVVFMAASCVLVIAIMLITGYEVMMRYAGIDVNLSWPTEIIDNLLIYMTFLGTGWLLKQQGHIAIDVVYLHQGPKTRLVIDLIISVMGIFVCLVMTWYSAERTMDDLLNGIREYKTVAAPRGLIIGIMPIGFLMLAIEFIRQFIGRLAHLKTSDH
jgi:TRAP-type C4-dicarboxylate transport system permease small subunit